MAKVVVFTSVTLDGMMQAPGGPTRTSSPSGPHQKDNPFTEVLDNTLKYVASTTLEEPLPWRNSTVLEGDAAEAVAELRLTDSVTTTTGVIIATYQRRSP